MEPIRLLLLDDHVLFRESLGRLLASEPDFVMAGHCGTSAEALGILQKTPVDVILLDYDLGDDHGAQSTGLGLFLSRAFVRSFHGELRHDPTVAGCSFVIELAVAGPREREFSRMAEHGTHPVATA